MAIAVAEARLTESTHLEPEHIFLALLKSEDISAEKVGMVPAMKNTPFFAQNLRRQPGFPDCLRCRWGSLQPSPNIRGISD